VTATALARRLMKLEVSARQEERERFREAIRQLRESLAPEHARQIREWILGTELLKSACDTGHPPIRFCLRCVEASDPLPLVRAFWVLLFIHIERGVPAVLPPDAAMVYVEHADAAPGFLCPGCGYLLPARGDGLAFDGPCPGCRITAGGRVR
jgi:hypothetical protein